MSACHFCENEITESKFMLLNDIIYKSCPGCSKSAGMHVFYRCPELFGCAPTRANKSNPLGLQSHCAPCRSEKQGPHENAVLCSQVKEHGGYVINEVRILPMSLEVFGTYTEARELLLNTMPSRGNTYYFKTSKMNCSENTLVFFQSGGCLIGYAIHLKTILLEKPIVLDDGESYNGYYQFAENSVTLFDKLIGKEKMVEIYPEFKTFNQSHQFLPAAVLPAIFSELNTKSGFVKPYMQDNLPEEIADEDIQKLREGAKKIITVNAYERNDKARRQCINYYKKKNGGVIKCEICGFNFGKTYGIQFYDKIHVHHIVEISTIGAEYEIDASKDLIPICPNCHMVAHSRKPAYTPEEIKSMLKNN